MARLLVGLFAVLLLTGGVFADPIQLTVVRDLPAPDGDAARVVFRWNADPNNPTAQTYRLWYSRTWPINFGGLNYIDIDVSGPNYHECAPPVPDRGTFDYVFCYPFSTSIAYFAMTTVHAGGCVFGTITALNGNPVAGATVCFSRTALPDTCILSNAAGQYVICGLEPGAHLVTVSIGCEAPQTSHVNVSPYFPVQHDVQITSAPIVQKTGHITANETWVASNIYQLVGQVIVDPGVVLTIQPGTRIIGAYPTVSVLICAAGPENCSGPGGGLYAVGTPTNPIVFTSNRPCGQRANGDWGGIVLNGRAHNNRGIVPNGEGDSGPFGKGVPCNGDVSCSGAPYGSEITMRYVRLEFPGFRYTPTNELNGLCIQSIGAGADISYIQVQRGQDDCLEWFGGTASVHHMVLCEAGDDHFDWTDGAQMAASHVVIHARMPDSDRGIEADNLEDFNDCLPRAHGYLSNFTIIGGKGTASVGEYGATLRRGTEFTIRNFIVQSSKVAAFDLDDASTARNANAGLPFGQYDPTRASWDYSLFWDNGGSATEVLDPSTPAGIGDGHFYYENSEWNNQANFPVNSYHIAAPVGWWQDISNYRGSGDGSRGRNATNQAANPMLINPLGSIVPSGRGYDVFLFDPRPQAGSPALEGAAPSIPAPPYLPPWWPLPTPTYRGAFSGPNDNWMSGWTDFPVN